MWGTRITTPSGRIWTVRRRWVPHREGKRLRERWRRRPHTEALSDGATLAGDLAELPAVGIVAAVIGGILLVIVMTIWFPFVVLLAIDLVWLTLVLVGGLVGRVILRRPWRVDAQSGAERRRWHVQGFRAAGQLRNELARQFRHGQDPAGWNATEPSR